MPTSAAGTAERPARARGERGFTLVELIVVIVIIGLVAAAVTASVPAPGGGVALEADRFAARARALQERAVMENRAYAVRLTGAGYAFERRDRGKWQPLGRAGPPEGLWEKGTQVSGGGVLLFDSTGFAEPFVLTLSRGRSRASVEVEGGTIHVRR